MSLLQLLGGEVEKTKLQKLLFLYSQRKQKPEYEFVPYKYGCYSYSASADLKTMIKKEYLLNKENGYVKNDEKDYIKLLKPADKKLLVNTVITYGEMNNDALIQHTYINFPYFAINSTIAEQVLNEKFFKRIVEAKPKQKKKTLFTIGYEGISLENYLNKLVKNNIKLLIDVRKNPLSMKFGFSKTLLKKYCENLGIEYLHIPEVGIDSSKRRKLENQEDYDLLFEDYKNTTLEKTKDNQNIILNLVNKYNRVALTCFEADICQCHRLPLSESIGEIQHNLEIKHI
ncbi:DUF488 domain-containing protein [Zunongwangia endophytica]|uniref:DUF488 family protein n=1 Tax=Zunongwangia endophytica TaxID=1808945 RepID=A0ABV8HE59_9FLAO|nr:DUF488 domain-containing protein [Zunongwangia endophytica]MDN3593462.1 DUF488 domain-containing protein [Zunongwangia endophytica]